MINKIFKRLIILAAFIAPIQSYAARIDTLSVKSEKMNKEIEVVVIVPDKAINHQECPTLYLLHGYSGNARTWINIKPELPDMADKDGIIVVCPDGENSWYWDSPTNQDSQFETFVSKELVNYIDSNYCTVKNRNGRAITGLSMGGHGGLWLSIRHKDIFGGGGATSGGVDIRPFPNNWEMKKQLGERDTNKEVWDNHTVITQLDKINNGDLTIIFDCGTSDFFFEVNNNLHAELLKRGINHDYITRPGAHDGKYWNNSIEYQWLYFSKFFKGYKSK